MEPGGHLDEKVSKPRNWVPLGYKPWPPPHGPGRNPRLRGDFHVIDGRVWFRNLLAHFTHGLEVRSQSILKVSARLFFGVALRLHIRKRPVNTRSSPSLSVR
jgi:hypothetical protein